MRGGRRRNLGSQKIDQSPSAIMGLSPLCEPDLIRVNQRKKKMYSNSLWAINLANSFVSVLCSEMGLNFSEQSEFSPTLQCNNCNCNISDVRKLSFIEVL